MPFDPDDEKPFTPLREVCTIFQSENNQIVEGTQEGSLVRLASWKALETAHPFKP